MNMKPLRFRLSIVLMLFITVAFAQSDAQKSTGQSAAQKSFDKLKTLAGTWQGLVKAGPSASRLGQQAHADLAPGNFTRERACA